MSKSIIFDWQRGNIPYFTKAPLVDKDAVNMNRKVGELFAKENEELQKQAEAVEKIDN